MAGTTPWSAQSNVEPIAAVTIEGIANSAGFNVISGCAASYSGVNLDVTFSSGQITHTNTPTTVAGNSVTLVANASLPRWTYAYYNSSGVAAIVSGSAAATPAVPDPGANPTAALIYVQASLTIANSATYKLDKRVMAASSLPAGWVTAKYKTAAQTFTTNTSYADVTATSGNFAFAIGANEVWSARYFIPLTFGGTGGVKMQFTGPAAPTLVRADALDYGVWADAAATVISDALPGYSPGGSAFTVAGFSSPFIALNSSGATTRTLSNGITAPISITLIVVNGANAGTVTLQAAQNSSNSTTALGAGSQMIAQRMA